MLAQSVEEAIRATGVAEVPSDEVGLAILGPLRALDEVAYLRFACVYQAFTSVDDFEKAIARPARRTPGPLTTRSTRNTGAPDAVTHPSQLRTRPDSRSLRCAGKDHR